jgi:hypothetical protein
VIEGQPQRSKAAPAVFALGALGGGVVGAALALGGVYFVQLRPEGQAIARRFDALEAAGRVAADERKGLADRLGAAEAKPDPTVDIRKQIEALQTEAKSRADALAKLEGEVAAPKPDAALTARVSALEAASAELSAAAKSDPTADIRKQIEALQVEAKSRADALAKLESDIATLAAASAKLHAAADAAQKPDPRLDALARSADTLAARLGKLEGAVFAPKVETRLAPATEVRSADPAARAVAALALVARVRAGDPFAAEFAALKRTGADPAALAALEGFADTGVPGQAALARSFAEIEPKILAALAAPAAPAGVVDGLLGEVKGLVEVRKVGEPGTPPPPESVVSRAEAAAKSGNLASAVAALKSLPDNAQAPAKAWIEAAERRLAAVPAAESLLTRAIADLAKS